MPVAGRAGIASALVVEGRVFVIDCGRGAPSAFVEAGLDFTRLEAVFLSHLHVDHTGDLPGMLLYPWGCASGRAVVRSHPSASMDRPRRWWLPLVMRHSAGRRPSTRSGPFPE
jgi:ribonuclease BN (tRNA processing enzyme)